MNEMARQIRRPSDALIIALEEVGLRSRNRKINGITKHRDFSVTGIYRRGERWYTIAVIYSRHANGLIVEHADQIEKRTANLGYPFYVRTSTHTLMHETDDQPNGYVHTRVTVSN